MLSNQMKVAVLCTAPISIFILSSSLPSVFSGLKVEILLLTFIIMSIELLIHLFMQSLKCSLMLWTPGQHYQIKFPAENNEKRACWMDFLKKASSNYFVDSFLLLYMVIYSLSPNQEKDGIVMTSLKHICLGIICHID